MTFFEMEDALIEELEQNVLNEISTTNADGDLVNGLTGYKNRLPVTQSFEGDATEFFPYFIVRTDSGKTKKDDDWWHVSVDIIIGIHDIELDGHGHEHVLIAIQRIVDRFVNDPQLHDSHDPEGLFRYRAEQDMEWASQEDDTYPFYFGAVAITFAVPKINRRAYDEYC